MANLVYANRKNGTCRITIDKGTTQEVAFTLPQACENTASAVKVLQGIAKPIKVRAKRWEEGTVNGSSGSAVNPQDLIKELRRASKASKASADDADDNGTDKSAERMTGAIPQASANGK